MLSGVQVWSLCRLVMLFILEQGRIDPELFKMLKAHRFQECYNML